MWHWTVEAVEAALLGGLAVTSYRARARVKVLQAQTVTDRAIYKRLYEKNAARWADHIQSRMH